MILQGHDAGESLDGGGDISRLFGDQKCPSTSPAETSSFPKRMGRSLGIHPGMKSTICRKRETEGEQGFAGGV
jgi:hypothetical protein